LHASPLTAGAPVAPGGVIQPSFAASVLYSASVGKQNSSQHHSFVDESNPLVHSPLYLDSLLNLLLSMHFLLLHQVLQKVQLLHLLLEESYNLLLQLLLYILLLLENKTLPNTIHLF
jgi:hypothetical protein